MRVGGGTSIMPRVAPTLREFVTADDGEYLKVAEAVFRIFDRQEWLRRNRARARIKVLVDKIGADALRDLVDDELRGDWVQDRAAPLPARRGGQRPRPAAEPGEPQRRPAPLRPLRHGQRACTAPGRVRDRPGEG